MKSETHIDPFPYPIHTVHSLNHINRHRRKQSPLKLCNIGEGERERGGTETWITDKKKQPSPVPPPSSRRSSRAWGGRKQALPTGLNAGNSSVNCCSPSVVYHACCFMCLIIFQKYSPSGQINRSHWSLQKSQYFLKKWASYANFSFKRMLYSQIIYIKKYILRRLYPIPKGHLGKGNHSPSYHHRRTTMPGMCGTVGSSHSAGISIATYMGPSKELAHISAEGVSRSLSRTLPILYNSSLLDVWHDIQHAEFPLSKGRWVPGSFPQISLCISCMGTARLGTPGFSIIIY